MAIESLMEDQKQDLIEEIPPVQIEHFDLEKEKYKVEAKLNTKHKDQPNLNATYTQSDLVGYISDYVSEDDDAAVYLQQLGINYAVSARSTLSKTSIRGSTFRRTPSASQSIDLSNSKDDEELGILCRQQSTKALVEISNLVNGKGGEGQLYRLLSAKRNHINQISNDVVYLQRKNKELEDQNRLLIRLGKRQEAALKKYQNMKSELPHIIETHRRDIFSMQEKIRRLTDASRKDENRMKNDENRILKLTEEVSKLREITKKRNLPERDFLQNKIFELNKDIEIKEKTIQDLRHKLKILEKSVKQQVTTEMSKQRAIAKKLQQLQYEHSQLKLTLKNREKELSSLQIYKGRLMANDAKSRIKLNSSFSNSSTSSISMLRKSRSPSKMLSANPKSSSTSEMENFTNNEESFSTSIDNELRSDPSKLPPISADIRRKQKENEQFSAKRTKHRLLNKDSEEWRAARRRQWRGNSTSPHESSDESSDETRPNITPKTLSTPRSHTPLTSPPSPMINSFNIDQKDLISDKNISKIFDNTLPKSEKAENGDINKYSPDSLGSPTSNEYETINLEAEALGLLEEAKPKMATQKELDETRLENVSSSVSSITCSPVKHLNREETSPSGSQSDDRFSLIGSYPPRERRRLETEKDSDSGGSGSPLPSSESEAKLLSRRNSLKKLNSIDLKKGQKFAAIDTDLRTISSLSNIDDII